MKWEKLINWEHGFHINLRQTTYSKELAYVIFCCQNPIDTGFFNRLLLGMKSGFYMSTTQPSASGSILKICQNRNQKTTCIRKKLCCQFDGISKVLSTMKFYVLIPQSTLNFTANNFQNLKVALQANRPERRKVRLLHDNAKPHTSKITRQKLEEFGWEVLPHPPYSPDLAPSDYHLFRSLRNHLVKKQFDDQAQLKSDLENFFSSLSRKFFEDGILDLPNRWEYVIDNNGIYVVD